MNESRDECTEWSGDERGVSRIEFLRASVSEQWDVTGGYLLQATPLPAEIESE